jgi:hypothetical protein
MLIAINSATGTVFVVADLRAFSPANVSISLCDTFFSVYPSFVVAQVLRFVTGKLPAANTLVNPAFLPVFSMINNRGAGLCLGH